MQVELVAHTPLGSMSGIGRYLRELYAHLQDRIPVRVVRPIDPPLSRFLSPLHHFPLGLRGHQPGSIVHFTQIVGCSLMLWRPVRPAIATVHDLGVLVCPEDELLFNRFDRWLLDVQLAGLRRTEILVAVSEFTKGSLMECLGIPEDRVHVIYEGVDRERFRPVADSQPLLAERYGVHPLIDTFDLLYVGNEQPRKNLGVLLKALARLKAQGCPARLIKVGAAGGERWRQRFLEQIRALQVDGDVVIIDSVSETDLALFYCAADLYVTPSLLEGFGLPVLEAMACGTPVVCSNAGALPEVVGDAGRMVDPRDPDLLTSTIASVLDDSVLRRRMSERGMARAARFTWQKTAEHMIQVYRSLARAT